MPVSIHQIIAAICPDVFCHPAVRREVKRILRDRTSAGDPAAYLKAAQVAKPPEPNAENLDRLQEMNPFDLPGLKAPIEKHTLVYDAPGDSLERVYFLVLGLLEQQLGWQVVKLVDLVTASPGSSLAQQWGQRSSRAIEETLKLFHAAQEQTQRLLYSRAGGTPPHTRPTPVGPRLPLVGLDSTHRCRRGAGTGMAEMDTRP
jgi:hypothetical protein